MLDATPLLRLYAARRRRQLERRNAVETQRRQLLSLLARARDTRFGMDHRFFAVSTVERYQKHVPPRRHDAFWRDYWQPPFPSLTDITWPGTIPYFAVSSGTTTGVTKYIPCSPEMVAANRRAALDILVHHLSHRPGSRVLGGRNFMLGGSTELVDLAPGIQSGDLSGIAAKTVPWWARPRYFPPPDLETIADWEAKIARLAPESLKRDIRTIAGTPSWLFLFFEKLAEMKPGSTGRIADFYPNLELLIHGGVNFAPYRSTFASLLEGSRAETREVYAASEGFIAVADRGDGEGLRLIVDNGLFFEFIPVEDIDSATPTRHWLANAETGVNYALLLTTCAGLWSYVVGDTVRLVERDPPRVLVTGRVSQTLSAFGEHLIGEEIEEAVTAAAAAIDAGVTDYSAGPVFAGTDGGVGGHLYIVEFAGEVPSTPRMEAFARVLDERLAAANEDYAVHRAGGYGLRPPRAHPVAPGTFAAWMKIRGQLGGQHKVPRVINDPDLFDALRRYTGHA
jgi:hypothetical protein